MKAVVFILISNNKLRRFVKTFLVPLLTVIVSISGEINTKNDMMKIEYEITSGSVNSFTSDTNTTSLILDITVSEDGSLNVTLPRKIIDSIHEEQDDIFYILIDGEEVMHTETVTEDYRTLTIPITKGSRQIEIIGTETINELVTIGYNLALATMIST
tara:strand:+ start:498 stop:971 length:474 start_codon:yes stop_codon:yes gene_type:complete